MPLITITGMPLSGKTTRAQEIQRALQDYIQKNQSPIRNVILVNEESLGIDKKEAYKDANTEKKARASIISAVERYLTREDIVICDSLNYIKGFRYQLYCVARGIGTPCCTLYCGLEADKALETNKSLDWYDNILENLCSRYEEPDGRNRWDAPLFIVISEDKPFTLESDTIQKMVDAVILKKAPAPNLSTVVTPVMETNYLHELDQTTNAIINSLVEAQKEGRMGLVKVPNSDVMVRLPSRHVALSEFRRIKKQFMNINKTHTMLNMKTVANTFSEHLNTNLS